jgi:hypothetical protein
MKDLILNEIEKIEAWKGDAYQSGDDVAMALEEIKTILHRNIDTFISVCTQTPPLNVEVIAQSPSGITHITYWRESYGVFMCQAKYEDASDWKWKLI